MISLIKGEITKMKVDAIVNAANSPSWVAAGVDGAIHRAGGPAILEECRKIRAKQGGCYIGEAVITTAGQLPAKLSLSILLVRFGMAAINRNGITEQLLRVIHYNYAVAKVGLQPSPFSNISYGGDYHFPKPEAAAIAIETGTTVPGQPIKQ